MRMSNFRRWSALALATVAAAAWVTPATAQDAVETRSDVRKLSVLLKSKVVIQDDQPAGQVVDVVLSDSGCVDYLVASRDDQYYVVPYAAVDVRYPQNVVFIDIAPAQFSQVQFFSANRWPDLYASSYRQSVFRSFNVSIDAADRGRRSTLKPAIDRDRDTEGAATREERRERRQDRQDRRNGTDSTATDRDRNTTTNPEPAPRDRNDATDSNKKDSSRPEGINPQPKSSKSPSTATPKRDNPLPKPDLPKPDAPQTRPDVTPKNPLSDRGPQPGAVDPPGPNRTVDAGVPMPRR